ncbi:MAG: IS1634 family transposase [Cuniculiplasma sp.]
MVVFTIITGKVQRIRKPVKGEIYVYDRTPYYDPVTRNTKYHYRYVGKETGGEIRKVRSVLPRRSLIYGPFIPILAITDQIGLHDMLKSYLTEEESKKTIAIAISKVVRPLPMSSIQTWYEGTYLSTVFPANLDSRRNSEFMEKIGSSDLYRKFSQTLMKKLHPSDSLLYDITSIPSYSSASIFEYGHAKDHSELEQINLSLVMEKSRKIPLSFEIYPGSIPDVVTLRRTMQSLSSIIPQIAMILDRGFFSVENLRILNTAGYVIAASLVRKEIKSVFSSASRSVDRADNVIMYEGQPIFCKGVSFTMEELELHGYFYHDMRRESEERADLHRNVRERRKKIEAVQARRGMWKIIQTIAGPYMRYITCKIKNNTVVTSAKDNAISAAENRMGRFLLVYNGEYSGSECLNAYRQRDAIEKAFRILKTDLDIFPMRDHKEPTVRGTMFVFFLSLLIRSALARGMESTKLNEKYSMERMFLELEKLHVIEDQNGDLKELERTRKQKDILDSLNSISWW